MPVSTDPAAEACAALVTRINSGGAYTLPTAAAYSRVEINPLEEISTLRVDVAPVEEEQLHITLDGEDPTSHKIAIWVRDKVADMTNTTLDALALIVRQIYQRVNNYTVSGGRVKVWEVDKATHLVPDKEILRQHGLFVATIILRVQVEASP